MDQPYEQNQAGQDTTYHYHRDQIDNWQQWNQPAPKKKKKTGWTGGKVVALTLCASLLSGALGAGGAIAFHMHQSRQTPAAQQAQSSMMLEGIRAEAVLEAYPVDTAQLMTPAEVYAANVNSTVGITTSITTNFWGYQTTSAASGSGFILSEDGYILTNHHVIEGSSAITVTCYNGDTYDARLVGYDAGNDIAVLKVEAEGLSPVILGSSQKLNVGDSVVAIGNPLGELTFSLTSGAVSALDRQITLSTGSNMKLIQTDCAINSGNSGGALFNLYGEVVGITNAKYSSSSSGASIDNIGFAIPIDTVRPIVESIIEKGYVSKPYVGIQISTVSKETQSYGLPAGAAVQMVYDDSPAQQAGLQVSDIITAVDGTPITASGDLTAYISATAPGDVLELEVFRQGTRLRLTVTVGEQVQSATSQSQPQPQSSGFWGR